MAEVLAESLMILERHANRLPVPGQRVAERVRIEVRDADRLERLAEDLRIGVEVRQPARSSPLASNRRSVPLTTRVLGNSASSGPQNITSLRCRTQPSKISRMSSPTGTK